MAVDMDSRSRDMGMDSRTSNSPCTTVVEAAPAAFAAGYWPGWPAAVVWIACSAKSALEMKLFQMWL